MRWDEVRWSEEGVKDRKLTKRSRRPQLSHILLLLIILYILYLSISPLLSPKRSRLDLPQTIYYLSYGTLSPLSPKLKLLAVTISVWQQVVTSGITHLWPLEVWLLSLYIYAVTADALLRCGVVQKGVANKTLLVVMYSTEADWWPTNIQAAYSFFLIEIWLWYLIHSTNIQFHIHWPTS